MRKFILYFLLALLFAAVATSSYGFLNGKKVQSFAAQLSQIRESHDLAPQVERIEASFRDNGKKEISQIRNESKQFSDQLEEIIRRSEAAKKETGILYTSKKTEETKRLAEEYYAKLALEAADLKGIISYMNQIIEVAAVFGEMKENASLEELKNLIADAKEKGNAVEIGSLSKSLETSAQGLKDSMNVFLAKMEDMAMLKLENAAELDSSYATFSQKEDEFFGSAKKYIDGMENLDILEHKINSDIERLGKIKFSLR